MQALLHPSRDAVDRSTQIISLVALNRARSSRTLDRDPGGPHEAYPWAYAFPRPAMVDSRIP